MKILIKFDFKNKNVDKYWSNLTLKTKIPINFNFKNSKFWKFWSNLTLKTIMLIILIKFDLKTKILNANYTIKSIFFFQIIKKCVFFLLICFGLDRRSNRIAFKWLWRTWRWRRAVVTSAKFRPTLPPSRRPTTPSKWPSSVNFFQHFSLFFKFY